MSGRRRVKPKQKNIRVAQKVYPPQSEFQRITTNIIRDLLHEPHDSEIELMSRREQIMHSRSPWISPRFQEKYQSISKKTTRPLTYKTSSRVSSGLYLRKVLYYTQQNIRATQIINRTAAQRTLKCATKKGVKRSIAGTLAKKRVQNIHMFNNALIESDEMPETVEIPSKIPIWKNGTFGSKALTVRNDSKKFITGKKSAKPKNMVALMPKQLTIDMGACIANMDRQWESIIQSLGPLTVSGVDAPRRLTRLIRTCSDSEIQSMFALPVSFEYLSSAVLCYQYPSFLTEETKEHRDTLMAYDRLLATRTNDDPIAMCNHRFRIWQLYQDMRALELVNDPDNEIRESTSCPAHYCCGEQDDVVLPLSEDTTQSDTSVNRKRRCYGRPPIVKWHPIRFEYSNCPVIYEMSDEDEAKQEYEDGVLPANFPLAESWVTDYKTTPLGSFMDLQETWSLDDTDDEIEAIIDQQALISCRLEEEWRKQAREYMAQETYESFETAQTTEEELYNTDVNMEPSESETYEARSISSDGSCSCENCREVARVGLFHFLTRTTHINNTTVAKKSPKKNCPYLSIHVTRKRPVMLKSRKARLIRKVRKVCTSWVLTSTHEQTYKKQKATLRDDISPRASTICFSSDENYLCPNCSLAGCEPLPRSNRTESAFCRYQTTQFQESSVEEPCEIVRTIQTPPPILTRLLVEGMHLGPKYGMTHEHIALPNTDKACHELQNDSYEESHNNEEPPQSAEDIAIAFTELPPSQNTGIILPPKVEEQPCNVNNATKRHSEESLNDSSHDSDEFKDVYNAESLDEIQCPTSTDCINEKAHNDTDDLVNYYLQDVTEDERTCKETVHCEDNNESPASSELPKTPSTAEDNNWQNQCSVQ